MNKHMARDHLSPTLSDWKVGGAGVTYLSCCDAVSVDANPVELAARPSQN